MMPYFHSKNHAEMEQILNMYVIYIYDDDDDVVKVNFRSRRSERFQGQLAKTNQSLTSINRPPFYLNWPKLIITTCLNYRHKHNLSKSKFQFPRLPLILHPVVRGVTPWKVLLQFVLQVLLGSAPIILPCIYILL
jgi:hypothetical protein